MQGQTSGPELLKTWKLGRYRMSEKGSQASCGSWALPCWKGALTAPAVDVEGGTELCGAGSSR